MGNALLAWNMNASFFSQATQISLVTKFSLQDVVKQHGIYTIRYQFVFCFFFSVGAVISKGVVFPPGATVSYAFL